MRDGVGMANMNHRWAHSQDRLLAAGTDIGVDGGGGIYGTHPQALPLRRTLGLPISGNGRNFASVRAALGVRSHDRSRSTVMHSVLFGRVCFAACVSGGTPSSAAEPHFWPCQPRRPE